MKILYVCADRGVPLRGGKGASAHLRQIAAALHAAGHDVTLVVRSLSGDNPSPAVSRIIALPEHPQAQTDQLTDLLSRRSIEVVLERYALNSGAAAKASAALGVPLVYEVNAPIVLEAARYRGLKDVTAELDRERILLSAAAAALVVSSALQDYLGTVAPELPVTLVHNGVDLNRFTAATHLPAAADKATKVGFVGSMKPWHGVQDLVTAFAAVATRHPHAQLVLAGHGPALASVQVSILATALSERVQVLGEIPHDGVPAVLASMDIAVAPYRASDDFYFSPLKVLEYLAAGLPVVHPWIGDLPALVGDAGLPYPANDVPALTACLDRLLSDRGLRRQLGAAAVHRSRRRGWEHVAAQVSAVLAQAVATPPRNRKAYD